MNPLSLNISNLHLQVRLRDLRPAILQEVARAFAPFVGPNGETPHETLEVVKLRVPRRSV
jgi:hypothetical protein